MLRCLLLISTLALTALAGDAPNGCADGKNPWRRVQHDVLVLGGGPAGLQATMSLARLGRTVMMVDNHEYRNAATLKMHDVPALDGTPPPLFREAAHKNLDDYPSITYSSATITRIEDIKNGTYFVAHGTNGERFITRKVVLASGVVDELPQLEGIESIWGISAYWCLWCDGWEHRNGQLAVLTTADLDDAIFAAHALNVHQTTLLTDGQRLSPSALNKEFFNGVLAAAKAVGIRFDPRKLARVAFVHPEDRETSPVRVFFTDGSTSDYKGLLVKTVRRFRSPNVIKSLGVKLRGSGEKVFIDTADRFGSTSVFGVFAAGDLMAENQNVANAFRSGKLAGIKLVHDLSTEEALALAGYDWRGSGKC